MKNRGFMACTYRRCGRMGKDVVKSGKSERATRGEGKVTGVHLFAVTSLALRLGGWMDGRTGAEKGRGRKMTVGENVSELAASDPPMTVWAVV